MNVTRRRNMLPTRASAFCVFWVLLVPLNVASAEVPRECRASEQTEVVRQLNQVWHEISALNQFAEREWTFFGKAPPARPLVAMLLTDSKFAARWCTEHERLPAAARQLFATNPAVRYFRIESQLGAYVAYRGVNHITFIIDASEMAFVRKDGVTTRRINAEGADRIQCILYYDDEGLEVPGAIVEYCTKDTCEPIPASRPPRSFECSIAIQLQPKAREAGEAPAP